MRVRRFDIRLTSSISSESLLASGSVRESGSLLTRGSIVVSASLLRSGLLVATGSLLASLLATPAAAGISSVASWTVQGTSEYGMVGYSVSTAGDVNGDGYDDVIVGEPGYDAGLIFNVGRARIYHGGYFGLSTTPAWSVVGGLDANLGFSVSTAGDVNGDGYDDVIVGAPSYSNGQNDEGLVRVYLGSPTGVSTTAQWEREGGQLDALLGYSVSTAGDVNGDGYDDIIAGTPQYDAGEANQGRVLIYLGSPSGVSSSVHAILLGEDATDEFGTVVSAAGDVNGDGYDDVLVSAYYAEIFLGPSNAGAVYCYLGSASGIDATADWSKFGVHVDEHLGDAISTAGDVNGDGFSDILIGASWYTDGQSAEGAAYVYDGNSLGLSSLPSSVYVSNQTNAHLGGGVKTGGDINADGYADIVIGAPRFSADQGIEGRVQVYYGSSQGAVSSAVVTIEGNGEAAYFGHSVSTAGDVDGDGRSDLLVGSPYFEVDEIGAGRAQVFLANADDYSGVAWTVIEANQSFAATGSSVGFADVNADGYSDLLAGSWRYDAGQTDEGRVHCWLGGYTGISGAEDWSIDGEQAGAFLGRVIANAGDVNGDGYEDAVVTAPGWDETFANEGKAWVYHGSPTGLETAFSWSGRAARASASYGTSAAAGDVNGDGYGDLVMGSPGWSNPQSAEGAAILYLGSASGLDPNLTVGWEGNQDDALAGTAVAMADVNGDGYSDILSGAPMQSLGENEEGVVYVFFGGSGPLDLSPSQILEGDTRDAHFGTSIASAGDVNLDGFSDVVIGSPGWWNGELREGRVTLHLGSPEGLEETPAFAYESDVAGASLGAWVASAGDANSDGRSDFVAGAPDFGSHQQGHIYVFQGSASGASSFPIFEMTGSGTDAGFGERVTGGGDVDGDGYPDLAVGAPGLTNGQIGEGRVSLLYGNRHGTADFAEGRARIPHMRLPDDSAPLALLGRSDAEDAFRIRALARSAYGRSRVRVEWEVKPHGAPWTGIPEIGSWIDSGTPIPDQGSRGPFNEVVSGLSANTRYRFRMRFESESPYFPRTPWISLAGNAPTEMDCRTAGAPSSAPELAEAPHMRFDRVMPNPMRSDATIVFSIAEPDHVTLTVHDVAGRRVATLLDAELPTGTHAIDWTAKSGEGMELAPGVYFARLASGAERTSARIVVAR